MSMPRYAACLLGLVLPAITWAQAPQAKPGDEMIEKYLAQETAKLSQRVLDGAKTLDEWQARRPRLKEEYLYMLGLSPLPEKTPLNAKITGTLERDDFVVEKLHFQSKPGLYVTGNLYRPKKITGKLPAVLYVCGHSNRGRSGNKTAFQDHGMWFATNGYVCLAIDTLQLGEIPDVHHGTYGRPYLHLKAYGIPDRDKVEPRWWWHAAGYTPAGVECWNGIRAIDYLASRPDVDPERIAVTGISGGGAATFWIAAADERVKCAVPVSGMSDLESYVPNKVINGHCDCMFLINTYQWEWTTIAALVAPRPLLFANSDMDRIFPMDANRRIIDRLRTLYKMHGKQDLVDEYVSAGGHDYRPDLRIAIFKWINKHIKNDTGPVKDADFKFFKEEELRVFPADRDIPADAINGKIDETFVPRAQVKLPEAGKFEEWKKGLMKELREQSFRPLPEKLPPAKGRDRENLETESNISVLYSYAVGRGGPPPVPNEYSYLLVILNPGEEVDSFFMPEWCRRLLFTSLAQFDGVHVVSVRGGGSVLPKRGGSTPTTWARKSPPNYVERSLALVGLTADAGRIRDIISVVRRLEEETRTKNRTLRLRLAAREQAGILAAYAALFEPSIQEVVIIDPPTSHKDGPYFLNVLRVLDIPEALGLLAPRPLTLINARDKAFDRTEQIYKLAGAEGKLQRK